MSTTPSTLTAEKKAQLLNLKDITNLVNVPKLKLSQKIISQISYYHHKVGNIEWSGPLIYSRTGADNMNDLFTAGPNKTMELYAEEVLLADVGTSGFTSYELNDREILDKIMDYQLDGKHLGHIHTHHNMATFFSGVDNEELQENTPNHKMYLSLIVNYKDGGSPVARLCCKASEKTSLADIFTNTKVFSLKKSIDLADLFIEKECIYYIDLEIEYDLDDISLDRYSRIIKSKEASKLAARNQFQHTPVRTYESRGMGNSWQRSIDFNDPLDNKFNDMHSVEEDAHMGLDMTRSKLLDFMYRVSMCDFDTPSDDIDLDLIKKSFQDIEKYDKINKDFVSANLNNIADYTISIVWQLPESIILDDTEIFDVFEEVGEILSSEFKQYKVINTLFKEHIDYLRSFLLVDTDLFNVNDIN